MCGYNLWCISPPANMLMSWYWEKPAKPQRPELTLKLQARSFTTVTCAAAAAAAYTRLQFVPCLWITWHATVWAAIESHNTRPAASPDKQTNCHCKLTHKTPCTVLLKFNHTRPDGLANMIHTAPHCERATDRHTVCLEAACRIESNEMWQYESAFVCAWVIVLFLSQWAVAAAGLDRSKARYGLPRRWKQT